MIWSWLAMIPSSKGKQLAPVKLRPKISSSGGSSVFGVVVLVMVSFEGSISLILVPTDASA
jgi:hypothetical protein